MTLKALKTLKALTTFPNHDPKPVPNHGNSAVIGKRPPRHPLTRGECKKYKNMRGGAGEPLDMWLF